MNNQALCELRAISKNKGLCRYQKLKKTYFTNLLMRSPAKVSLEGTNKIGKQKIDNTEQTSDKKLFKWNL